MSAALGQRRRQRQREQQARAARAVGAEDGQQTDRVLRRQRLPDDNEEQTQRARQRCDRVRGAEDRDAPVVALPAVPDVDAARCAEADVTPGEHRDAERREARPHHDRDPWYDVDQRAQARGDDQPDDEEHAREGAAQHRSDDQALRHARQQPVFEPLLLCAEEERQEAGQHRKPARVYRRHQPSAERQRKRSAHASPAFAKADFSAGSCGSSPRNTTRPRAS